MQCATNRMGSGYRKSEDSPKITVGCAEDGCNGYELTRDLDFNDDASYSSVSNKVIWTEREGWQPIGYHESYNNSNNKPFKAIFEGNNHTISNLMINRPGTSNAGLFGYTARRTKIANISLSNVNIRGYSSVGGLVGSSSGDITNSYATGTVGGSYSVGGLVGRNYYGGLYHEQLCDGFCCKGGSSVGGLVGSSSGDITNSYATGSVEGIGNYVGGLVGSSSGDITNSYATGSVTGSGNYVGGLVGSSSGDITNSYATGSVTGSGNYVGGLVGENRGNITNSYATGTVEGNSHSVGGLVGRNWDGNITNSYWDTETNGITRSAGGIGKTTAGLQSPTTAIGIYAHWSTTNWDFGTASQYPVLRYVVGSDTNNPACRETEDTTKDLPVCGSLLSPMLRYGLSELRLTQGHLSPDFIVLASNYIGTIVNKTSTIRLIPITINSSAKISIKVDEEVIDEDISSGTTSSEIRLNLNGTTKITIQVKNEGTASPITYTLYLGYHAFDGDIDKDDDGLIEIDSLEKLNAMRYQPDGSGYRKSEDSPKITAGCSENGCNGYELTRDLDFDDDASYGVTPNKVTWTTDAGWQPIGSFYLRSFQSNL